MKKNYISAIALLLCLHQGMGQSRYPGRHWQQYRSPEEAGWSGIALENAKKYSDSIGLAAVMVVYKGAVLSSWGDIDRKYLCHSMRKSFLSALYGMTPMNLDENLGQLGIDDQVHPLTTKEKQATIRDLLEARSGIFLPAAYEGNPDKPARESHPHGTFWLYNNWDFNALGTILEKKTGKRFFDDLTRRICTPLQMEDVDSLDVFYKYEPERSSIPAYTFKMSTRDLARFGLLYVNNGKWQDRQLVPAAWIRESTTPYSFTDEKDQGYGYLWWIENTRFKERGMYCAAGMGGHRIYVFPKDDLVVIVRADTYDDKSVNNTQEYKLLDYLLAGKSGPARPAPVLVTLPPVKKDAVLTYAPGLEPQKYFGRFQFQGEWMSIYAGKTGLMMDSQYMGKFYLDQFTESLFRLRDQENFISFLFDPSGKAVKLVYHDKSITGISKN